MPGNEIGATLRQSMRGAAVAALLVLAGCQSWLSSFEEMGAGVGASASAEEHLARIRADHGLPALVSDSRLEKAALIQSGYMAASARMTHNTGSGKDFATRMKKNGIDGVAAENLAHGRMDLDRLFSMWMNSSGHRKNMLDPRLTRFGLASAPAKSGDGRRYWTLVVGD